MSKNKFTIEEVKSLEEWENFAVLSLQYTIFVNPIYLNSFGRNYRLFFVKKGSKVKAGFCIILSDDEKEVVLDDLVIYAGILFDHNKSQKEVKSRLERFEITELIIDYLTNRYDKIEMALPVSFEDMRPFLWYNYHSSNPKEKFFVDLRYTSYLDITELKTSKNDEESLIFKNLETLRQRHIRKARKDGVKVVEEFRVEEFLQFYKSLMKSQEIDVPERKLENMSNIIKNIVKTKNGTMVVARNSSNEIIYTIVFSYDKYRAYYLFGAGNPEVKENYKGTICFWEGFKILANKYGINEVDLEGINSPQRGWFKLSFGGDIRPYYEIKLDR